jgi:hypothetical protein
MVVCVLPPAKFALTRLWMMEFGPGSTSFNFRTLNCYCAVQLSFGRPVTEHAILFRMQLLWTKELLLGSHKERKHMQRRTTVQRYPSLAR